VCPARQERKERITQLRRQQILGAAFDIFSQKGFDAATTAEIARAAGVAEGTIYNYFPSKRELFIEVIRNFIVTPPLLTLIDKLPGRDISVMFQNILKDRFKLLEDERISRLPTLMAEILRDPELKALWTKQFIQPFFSRMEGMYEKMMSSGKFRHMKPAVLVRAIGGMLLGSLMLKIMEGEASPLSRLPRDEIIDSMVELLLHGLLDETGLLETNGRSTA
jgi:AcrR family transcriptional regulator